MTDQTAAGLAEPSIVAYLVTGLARGEPSICFEDERGDYGDEDHMPIFEALVRKSDYAALLTQLEEQRAVSARMEARNVTLLRALQQIIQADDAHALTQQLIDVGRAAIDAALGKEQAP